MIQSLGNRNLRSVGQNISTKAIGSNNLDLLTSSYKHPENSEEEREAWKKAYSFGSRPDYFNQFFNVQKEGNTVIQITTNPAQPVIGKAFELVVLVKNERLKEIEANIISDLHTVFYTGSRRHFIKKDSQMCQIPAQSEREIRIPVDPKLLEGKRGDGHHGMKCTTVVECPEATVCDSHNFQLSPPTTMKITVRFISVGFYSYNPIWIFSLNYRNMYYPKYLKFK